MNYTNEQIEEAILNLSEEAQDMLFSPTVETATRKIGESVALNENQLIILAGMVNFVIMGLIERADLSLKIAENISVSPESSLEIASKINWQILIPILGAEKPVKENISTKQPVEAPGVKEISDKPEESNPSPVTNIPEDNIPLVFTSYPPEVPPYLETSEQKQTPVEPAIIPALNLDKNPTLDNLPTNEDFRQTTPKASDNQAQTPPKEPLDPFEEKLRKALSEIPKKEWGTKTETSENSVADKKRDIYREPIE